MKGWLELKGMEATERGWCQGEKKMVALKKKNEPTKRTLSNT
jgi:hypothetical protein